MQAAVVVAGVVMNILFAWLALSAGYVVGLPASTSYSGFGEVQNATVQVVSVVSGSPAERAGLQGGDEVTFVGTASTNLPQPATAEEVQQFITAHPEESIILSTLRDGEEKTFIARAEEGVVEGRKALGVQLDHVGVVRLPLHLALMQGAASTYRMTLATAEGLGTFFYTIARGTADFSTVAGPIGIAGIGAQAVSDGFATAVFITALISINLAIINLIPVPGLDGGRLFIIAIESVLRRPVSPRLTTMLTLGGMALLIGLMVLVSYHDIAKLIG